MSCPQGFFLTVNPEVIQIVAQHSNDNGKTFMMNLSATFLCEFFKEPMLEALPFVDVLFGNESEAEVFAKVNGLKGTDLKEIALEMSNWKRHNEKKNRTVVITQGSGPVLLAKDNTVLEFPVEKISEDKIVDTNGAGDAFVGGTQFYTICISVILLDHFFILFLIFILGTPSLHSRCAWGFLKNKNFERMTNFSSLMYALTILYNSEF